MIIDLVKLEKLAEEMEGYPGLHFEYWLSEAGGSGWIQLLPGKTLGIEATDLPEVVSNVMKFAAERLEMPEDVLRAWAELQMGGELPCDALTKAGKPCRNYASPKDVAPDPREFDPAAKVYSNVHRRLHT